MGGRQALSLDQCASQGDDDTCTRVLFAPYAEFSKQLVTRKQDSDNIKPMGFPRFWAKAVLGSASERT